MISMYYLFLVLFIINRCSYNSMIILRGFTAVLWNICDIIVLFTFLYCYTKEPLWKFYQDSTMVYVLLFNHGHLDVKNFVSITTAGLYVWNISEKCQGLKPFFSCDFFSFFFYLFFSSKWEAVLVTGDSMVDWRTENVLLLF